MAEMDDNYIDELTQIRDKQTEVLDTIDKIKDKYHGPALTEIERIQNDAIAIVMEIDEIRKRHEDDIEMAAVERNTILYRMKTGPRHRERIGQIWIG